MNSKDEIWALFWCNLLNPIIFGEIDQREINQYLINLSQKELVFPDKKIKKPSLSTLRRKLNEYKKGGFNSLARKRRNDIGKIRCVDQEIRDKAIELKTEQPMRSDDTINRFLDAQYGNTIARSTLYRHLKEAGATKLKLGVIKKKVRKRWSRPNTNDLWVGDFQEGPYVMVDTELLPTYLSLFIDCHSRYVVEGRYYLRQNFDVLMDSLIRAWSTHGTSKELYLDNAKVYHANQLKAACYSLNIKLLHRPPGDPSPGGLVERIFGTSQGQFEAEIRASSDMITLDKLNRAFSAYIAVVYHQRVHSETQQTPKDRYQSGLSVTRNVDMDKIIEFFMKKEIRTVHKDFSDVQINKKYYRVDPSLRGDRVEVRYDPFADMEKVWIYSAKNENKYLGQGTLYSRNYGAEIQDTSNRGEPKNNFIDLIVQQHDQQLNANTKGIDYREIISKRQWPFNAFVQKLAKLMGRKGGLGAFNGEELEKLKKTFNRIPDLDESMLIKAWEEAQDKSLMSIIYHLQIMKFKQEENK